MRRKLEVWERLGERSMQYLHREFAGVASWKTCVSKFRNRNFHWNGIGIDLISTAIIVYRWINLFICENCS
jgi:hypothetical protein